MRDECVVLVGRERVSNRVDEEAVEVRALDVIDHHLVEPG